METRMIGILHVKLLPFTNTGSLLEPKLSPIKCPIKIGALSLAAVHSAQKRKYQRKPRPQSPHSLTHETGTIDLRTRTQMVNFEVSPHRAVAAVRMLRIEQGGAFADLLNDSGKGSESNEMAYVERTLGFRTRDLENRDLKLVTSIVGGAIRWRKYLDYLIISLCNDENTFRNMEPLLLQILRIGFYEIVKIGMPPYAVVDENVNLAKLALRRGAGNMVNAILRKLVLLKESNSLPSLALDGVSRTLWRALATMYSHPVWMVKRWIKDMGQEKAVKLMIWNNSEPCFSLRANSGKGVTRADLITQINILEVTYDPSLHLDEFVRIRTGMQAVILAGLLKQGLCSVQDESAGLVVCVVDPQPGDIIIDCCAAPGGKTLFMASCLRSRGMISAVDINKGRLRILEETAKLQQVDNVITTVHSDLRMFADTCQVKYDKVLLDAPCSGLGVLSKRPDLRWNRKFEDMEELTKLQDELLDASSKLVKPGGLLVYSTCSIDPEENEQRVAAFLLSHPEFCIDPADRFIQQTFLTERGFYRSCPVKHSMDGAFAARLLRSAN
ncbi:hypothetical protein Dimus_014448 [Dionaea muscipula]